MVFVPHWCVGFVLQVCVGLCVCVCASASACLARECVCVHVFGGAAAPQAQKKNKVQSISKELISASVSPPPLSDVVSHIPGARSDL